MKPYYFFNRIGVLFSGYIPKCEKASTNWLNILKILRFRERANEKYRYKEWNAKDKSTFTTERGDKIQFTIGEKLYLYMLYRRPQGKNTLQSSVLDEAVKR